MNGLCTAIAKPCSQQLMLFLTYSPFLSPIVRHEIAVSFFFNLAPSTGVPLQIFTSAQSPFTAFGKENSAVSELAWFAAAEASI